MSLHIQNYTDRSFVVYSDEPSGTKEYKEVLMEMGGKYNPSLSWDEDGKNPDEEKRPGYIFPVKRKDEVRRWIDGGCVKSALNVNVKVKDAKLGNEDLIVSLLHRVIVKLDQIENSQKNLQEQIEWIRLNYMEAEDDE
jgi:hypothetical protein